MRGRTWVSVMHAGEDLCSIPCGTVEGALRSFVLSQAGRSCIYIVLSIERPMMDLLQGAFLVFPLSPEGWLRLLLCPVEVLLQVLHKIAER